MKPVVMSLQHSGDNLIERIEACKGGVMKVFLRFSALAFLVVCLVLLFGLRHRVSAQGNTISLTQTFCGTTTACVWTYHNDNNRDGVNPNEGTLTPTYVKHRSFSHIVVSGLDGLIYAQPLYIHGLYGSAGTVGTCTATQQSPLNVVFVATENNTVYAIDASTGNICWHLSVDRMAPSETAIPWMDQPQNGQNHPSTDLVPESGITSTPVIDLSV